jgi:hypothetical protein
MERLLIISKTQELLATRMLIYIFLDSNYIDFQEYKSEFLSIYLKMEMEFRQTKDYALLN